MGKGKTKFMPDNDKREMLFFWGGGGEQIREVNREKK